VMTDRDTITRTRARAPGVGGAFHRMAVQYIASTDPTLCGSMLKHEGRRQTDRRSADAGSRLKLIDASGRSRLIRQPFSRNGENSPYGMLGGIVETSASFEARSAPRSYPTGKEPVRPRTGGDYGLVSDEPASVHSRPARPFDSDDAGPLCLLRHHCCPNVFCSMDGNVLIAVGKLQF
jgi:hypothetical protein